MGRWTSQQKLGSNLLDVQLKVLGLDAQPYSIHGDQLMYKYTYAQLDTHSFFTHEGHIHHHQSHGSHGSSRHIWFHAPMASRRYTLNMISSSSNVWHVCMSCSYAIRVFIIATFDQLLWDGLRDGWPIPRHSMDGKSWSFCPLLLSSLRRSPSMLLGASETLL